MAEEKLEKTADKPEKSAKSEKPAKKGPGIFARIGRFLVDCKSELKKVVWLSRAETVKKTAVVTAMMIVSGAAVGIVDFLFTQIILFLGNLM